MRKLSILTHDIVVVKENGKFAKIVLHKPDGSSETLHSFESSGFSPSIQIIREGDGPPVFAISEISPGKSFDEEVLISHTDPGSNFNFEKYSAGGFGIHDIRDTSRIALHNFDLSQTAICFQKSAVGIAILFDELEDISCYSKIDYHT